MIIVLESQGKKARVIEYIKQNGFIPPLINIQNFKGKAKEYQVRQALDAINKLEEKS